MGECPGETCDQFVGRNKPDLTIIAVHRSCNFSELMVSITELCRYNEYRFTEHQLTL